MYNNNINYKTSQKGKTNKKIFSVCFSGYRPKKFDFPLINGNKQFEQLKSELKSLAIKLIKDGYKTFYIGLAEGFDVIAGEILLQCEKELNLILDIQCVLPYLNFFDTFEGDWGKRASKLIDETNSINIISMKYKQGVFYERNRFMVDNSKLLVCYYDGKKGGTKYTLDYAKKNNLYIINIANSKKYTQISLF